MCFIHAITDFENTRNILKRQWLNGCSSVVEVPTAAVNFQWQRWRQCFNGGNGRISTVMVAVVTVNFQWRRWQ